MSDSCERSRPSVVWTDGVVVIGVEMIEPSSDEEFAEMVAPKFRKNIDLLKCGLVAKFVPESISGDSVPESDKVAIAVVSGIDVKVRLLDMREAGEYM
jgi:hypothetical protein